MTKWLSGLFAVVNLRQVVVDTLKIAQVVAILYHRTK